MKTLFLIIGLIPFSLLAQPQQFYIDRLHSSVNFSMKYIEIMEFNGRADDYYGEFLYDSSRLDLSGIYCLVNAQSLNTAMKNRDLDLHSPEYMDSEKFPVIVFKSEKITKHNGQLLAKGLLTMKGKTVRVDLPFSIVGQRADARALMVVKIGPITINRSLFGIGTVEKNSAGNIFLGDKIRIWGDVLLKAIGSDEKKLRSSFEVTDLEPGNYAGTYVTDKGTAWTVSELDNKLFIILKSAAVFYRLSPIGDDTFIVNDVGSLMKFQRDATGNISGLINRFDESEDKQLNMKKSTEEY